jgi:predicted transcriptional regulator
MKLDEWRTKQGWSKQQLAKAIGVSNPCIQVYNEGGMPRLDVAIKIVEITGGAVSYLELVPEGKTTTRKLGQAATEEDSL